MKEMWENIKDYFEYECDWSWIRVLFIPVTILIGLIATGIILLLPKITTGEIYYKEIQPAQVETHLYPISTNHNIVIPYDKITPEKYMICIQDGDKKESFFVSKPIYDSFKIGDIYTYDAARGDEVN